MRSFIDLFDDYLTDVPGCTYAMATRAIRMAAQQFCERTRAWRVKLASQATVAGQAEYLFQPGADQRVVKTYGATIDGHPALILRPDQDLPGAVGIVIHNDRSFTIRPAPPAGQQVVFDCALAPANSAASLDDDLYARYARAIAIGAKAELFGMKKQPFSDMDAALDERGRFEVEITRAISDIGRHSSAAPVRVKASFM
jgi:hypothetical protein